jgi:hypothetical protein
MEVCEMRTRAVQHLEWLLTPSASPAADKLALFFAAAPTLQEAKKKRPEPPLDFSGHDYAVYLLHVAAEIEHVLMVQYLYAAYSLGGDQVPAQHRALVACWQETILGIAKEEMGHLITVQNVLRLLGGPLNLDRNDYPWDMPFSPFTFTLEPLSRASLARYVYTESPEKWPSDVSAAEKKEIEDLAVQGQTMPVRQVGELYRLMIGVISDPKLVPDDFFAADTLPYQADWDEWGRGYRQGARGTVFKSGSEAPDLIIAAAYSRGSAIDALQAVAEQGEAADDDPTTNERSHFRRFLKVYQEFSKVQGDWSPVLPLAVNPRATGGSQRIKGTTWIANPRSRAWAQLFNLRYRMLLAYLSHAFNLSGGEGPLPDAKARGMVVHRTFGEMYNLRTMARLLVHMPVGGAAKPTRAGPPFEMPYSIRLPRSERDCWRLHLDLLQASSKVIDYIERFAKGHERDYLETLKGVDAETMSAIEQLLGAGTTVKAPGPQLERSQV